MAATAPDRPLMVAYGGGLNSTAMLVGLQERGLVPNAILFSDTGGEQPETYAHIHSMTAWLARRGFPIITLVHANSKWGTLENECLGKRMLPSLAYGFKSCSQKWKRGPQEVWANHWKPALAAWKAGGKVRKMLGYDAGEERRAKLTEDEKYAYVYPLIEWGWDRDACEEAVARSGLKQPPKSSCFFCPAMTKSEIVQLKRRHPDMLARALEMEASAELKTRDTADGRTGVAGLGRRFAWADLVRATDAQLDMFPSCAADVPCDCFDGEAA